MKKSTLFTAVTLLIVFSAHAQWKQAASGQTSFISEISVVNSNVIWVKDQTGTSISYSLDGGKTYTNKALPANLIGNYVGNLCAVNATTAYTVIANGSEKGIYITTDNGATWTKQSTGFNASSPFPDFVYFWNENDGVAVGDAKAGQKIEIYTTTNGGNQWNLVNANSMPAEAIDESTTNSNRTFRVRGNAIYFKGSKGIYKSADKGLTWTFINVPVINFNLNYLFFDFSNDTNGLLVARENNINRCFNTDNGGNTWTEMPNAEIYGNIKYSPSHDTYFMSANVRSGGLLYTKDNGQSWTRDPSFFTVSLSELCITESNKLFAGGWGSVFYSTDIHIENPTIKFMISVNPNALDIKYTKALNSASSTNFSNYYIESIFNGQFIKQDINSITQDNFDNTVYHIVMNNDFPHDSIRVTIRDVDDSNGIPVLYNEPGYRMILKKIYSTNVSWKQAASGQTSFMAELSVVNSNVIWVMDQTGTSISYSLDGGKTYTNKALPANLIGNYVGNLCAVNATTAYTVIANGSEKGIYITTDNGAIWTKQSTGFNTNSAFPDFVHFWNENDGVAVGDAKAGQKIEIYTTTNGGNQWNLVDGNSMPAEAIDENTTNSNRTFRVRGNAIYFKGSKGIYKSADKGLTWTFINVPVINFNLNYLFFDFSNDKNGLLVVRENNINRCFNTFDGGNTWTEMPNTEIYGNIKYSPSHNTYFMSANVRSGGLLYTKDNGQSWIKNPSFFTVSLSELCITESNKLFAGGWGSVFYSTDMMGENPTIKYITSVNPNALDITYTKALNSASSTNFSNYNIESIFNAQFTKQDIRSITQDNFDNTVYHIVMNNDFPHDSIRVTIRDIIDSNGVPVLYNEPGYRTILKKVDPNGTNNIDINAPIIYSKNGLLFIENINAGSSVKIYDMMGRNHYSVKSLDTFLNVRLIENTVYIIQVNSKCYKIAI